MKLHFPVFLFFLFSSLTLSAQNCGCCEQDDCPCISECISAPVSPPKTKNKKQRSPSINPSKKRAKTINYIKTDIKGILTIQNKNISIQKGVNKISSMIIRKSIDFQFYTPEGLHISGVITNQNIKDDILNLKLSEKLSLQKIDNTNQKIKNLLNQKFLKFSLPNGKDIDFCKTEVPIKWFQFFIQATGYKTTADVKGYSIIRSPLQQRDIKKDKTNWQHDPLGKLQRDLNHPVVHVSWDDAQAFCKWLSSIDRNYTYRLPTFAEWEAALESKLKYLGLRRNEILNGTYANLADISLSQKITYKKKIEKEYQDGFSLTAPCGQFSLSGGQVYDIIGNVSEWIHDNPFTSSTPEKNKLHVGGSFFSNFENCHQLQFEKLEMTAPGIGFRVVKIKR